MSGWGSNSWRQNFLSAFHLFNSHVTSHWHRLFESARPHAMRGFSAPSLANTGHCSAVDMVPFVVTTFSMFDLWIVRERSGGGNFPRASSPTVLRWRWDLHYCAVLEKTTKGANPVPLHAPEKVFQKRGDRFTLSWTCCTLEKRKKRRGTFPTLIKYWSTINRWELENKENARSIPYSPSRCRLTLFDSRIYSNLSWWSILRVSPINLPPNCGC